MFGRLLTFVIVAILLLHADLGAVSLTGVTAHAGPSWLMTGLLGVALGAGTITLADWAKRLDPNGKVPTIVELLNQTNPILEDMNFLEGNLPTGHRTTVRTGLPSVFWRLLNQGVQPSKSTTAQIDEQAGMLEAWSEVDKDLALLNGATSEFRLSEAKPFLEAMNQEFARVLFYGNGSVNPEQFNGLSVRYSLSTAPNGSHVIKAGGVGADNASIWLIVWGENTVTGIFPKGSKAGLIHEDRGEQIIMGSTGLGATRMVALVDHFQWKGGIALKDWRYAVRICNIDISDLSTGSAAALITLMTKAIHRIPSLSMGRPVFYMNRTLSTNMDIQERADIKTGGGLTYDNVAGKPVLTFRGIPIRETDALLETEALVA